MITSWELGATIRFVAAWGDKVFEQWGTVLEFKPHTKLKYSLFAPRPDLADIPENYFYMTYQLEEVDDSTKLSIIQDDPRHQPPQTAEDDGSGQAVLNALKELVENGR